MIVKVIALGFIGTFVGTLLRKYNKELMPFFEMIIIVTALLLIKDSMSFQEGGFATLLRLFPQGEKLFVCLFKGAAITVITKLTSEICRESGNTVMGEIVELGGRVMLVVLSLPFITEVAQTALSFIG